MRAAVFTGSDLRSFGGGEKDLIGWANKVRGFSVTIFSFCDSSNVRVSRNEIMTMISPQVNVSYYRAIKIKYVRDLMPFSFSGLRSLWSLRKYDVVYSMHQGIFLNGIIVLVCKVFGIRYILGIHSPILFDSKPLENNAVKRILMKPFVAYRNFLISHIDNVRIQNSTDEASVRSTGFKGEIYNIPPHVFDQSKIGQIGSNSNSFSALFVGRLSVIHKGLDLLEEIVNITLQKNQEIRFIIIGSGREGDEIVKRITHLFPQNVQWKGFVKEEELVEEYRNASLFVFPSRGENFGISLGEAQMNGLPSVAFRVMGSEDLITMDTLGKLAKPFDTKEFSELIIQYYSKWKDDPEGYLQMKRQISSSAMERFSDEAMLVAIDVMLTGRGGSTS